MTDVVIKDHGYGELNLSKKIVDQIYRMRKVVDVFVSESDFKHPIYLAVVDAYVKGGVLAIDSTLEDVLYHVWGFDRDTPYEAELVQHTGRFKGKTKCYRYTGLERSDYEWYKNPMCSDNMKNKIESIISSGGECW